MAGIGAVARHKTAIRRTDLSRPVKVALAESIIDDTTTVFDYGCGHGADVRILRSQGIDVTGWDPVHRPGGAKRLADVVNLGYVLNVIEDPDERCAVLLDAWAHSKGTLVVSARLDIDARRQGEGVAYADGCLTGLGTFQKFYEQNELREFIDSTLGVECAAAAPGIFVIFRDSSRRETFVASRFRRRASEPRVRRSDTLFEEYRELLGPLMTFAANRGRLPEPTELGNADAVLDVFGSIKRAFTLVLRVTGKQAWDELKEQRRQDMCVFLALAAFPRRPKFSELSVNIQRDMRALFGSYQKARAASDELLFATGNQETLRAAARSSQVGKKMPEAIYVHTSCVGELPPLLRVYEGCARILLGNVPEATLLKLHLTRAQVSYLEYDEFDRDPHPALTTATNVHLDNLRVRRHHYDPKGNPPVLHRKELFVAEDYPGREKFARLTKQEEDWALYANPSEIGTRDGWNAVLGRTGLMLRGHRLVRKK